MSEISIKLVLRTKTPHEIRRVRVVDFDDLLKKLKNFTEFEDISSLKLQYVDDDQDWITFDTSQEFEEIRTLKKSPVRMRILSTVPQKPPKTPCERRRNRRHRRRFRNFFRNRFGMIPPACYRKETKPCKSEFPSFLDQWANGFQKNEFQDRFRRQMKRFKRDYLKPLGVCHRNIICDGCEKKEWIGRRWKCADCPSHPGFDLCGNCMVNHEKLHDPTHKFEEVPLPVIPQFFAQQQPQQQQQKEDVKKEEEVEGEEVEEVPVVVVEAEEVKTLPPISVPEEEVKEEEDEMVFPLIFEEKEEESIPMTESQIEVPEIPEILEVEEEKQQEISEEEKLKRKWESQLSMLTEMGFVDEVINTYLLEQQNGNVQRVIELLIQM